MKPSADNLFDVIPSTSPRSAWLARHNLVIRDYQDRRNGGWERHSLNSARFLCANRSHTRCASGDTQDAAEQAWCERYGVQWWKLAEWNGAMEFSVPRHKEGVFVVEEMQLG